MPCRITLSSPRDRYCPEHQDQMSLCTFRDCSRQRENGFQTCDAADHRAEELAHRETGQSIFQLKMRLFYSAQAEKEREAEENAAKEASANDPPRRSKKKSKAVFHRTWTHNEQLAVRPCGIIVSRATFYQAEAISGVKVQFVLSNAIR